MSSRVIHTHVETGDRVSLKKAIDADPRSIDGYQLCPELEQVIDRHGLKGTALHRAVAGGNIEKVRILLEAGADANFCVMQGEPGDEIIPYATALYIANKKGFQAIANLLKSNADKSSESGK